MIIILVVDLKRTLFKGKIAPLPTEGQNFTDLDNGFVPPGCAQTCFPEETKQGRVYIPLPIFDWSGAFSAVSPNYGDEVLQTHCLTRFTVANLDPGDALIVP